jgi:hypothetical protein
MTTEYNQGSVDENTRKLALNRRLEGFGWAALLITIGSLWLMPDNHVPQGSWLIAAGIIMLGLNALRHINGIRMSGFSLVVGTVALIVGLSAFFGIKLPLFAIVLIVIGIGILLMTMFETGSMCSRGGAWSCCGRGQDSMSQEQTRQSVGH